MSEITMLPKHPLTRFMRALSLLDWFDEWEKNLHAENDVRFQHPAPKWQTVADIRIEYAHDIISRAHAVMAKRSMKTEDLKYLRDQAL